MKRWTLSEWRKEGDGQIAQYLFGGACRGLDEYNQTMKVERIMRLITLAAMRRRLQEAEKLAVQDRPPSIVPIR